MQRFLFLALVALLCVGCGTPPTPAAPTTAPASGNPPAAAPNPTPAPTRAAPTATAVRQVAEIEFKWGPMDPNLMVNEGLGLAFQAEGVPGVIHARVTEGGIEIEYDPAMLDAARLRTQLKAVGVPIAD